MFKRICKITFVSHGATIYTNNGIINDNIKAPKLSDDGEEELKSVCEYLKNRGVSYDKIYTSPATYCVQSANVIAKLFKKKPETIDLKGRDYGDWNGQPYSSIFDEFGSIALSKTPLNGETLKHFNKRVLKIINELTEQNKGSRIIVLTTPDVIQAVLASVLELTPENQHRLLVKTGSLTQVSYFDGWSSVIYSDYKPL